MRASRPQRGGGRALDALVWFHRWLGIATCLIFALWFASGAVMVFEPFPSLSRGDQLAFQQPVNLAAVTMSPASALNAASGEATALRLVERGGVPTYVVETAGGLIAVDARTGTLLPLVSRDGARAVAHRLLGSAAGVAGPIGYDQWIVHNRFDPLRPFYRLDAGDAAGTELYLSARTGEIVQRTSRSERAWNWVGAVLHWVYFTPLRSSFTAWDTTVWLLSSVAMLVAFAGTVLGIIRTVAAQRLTRPALSFFRGKWMRWHHILGLFVSPIVLIWIFSGWLSMDHGRLFSRGQATPTQLAAFHGRTLRSAFTDMTVSALRSLPKPVEVAFDVIGDAATLFVSDRAGTIRPFDREGDPVAASAVLASAQRGVAAAWPRARVVGTSTISSTDVYALAEGWPPSAVGVTLIGADAPTAYIDGANGRLLTVMTASRANYAWLYYALHTFNFPFLVDHPVIRQTIVLILMLCGLAFSLTGVVIAIRRLRKDGAASRARLVLTANAD